MKLNEAIEKCKIRGYVYRKIDKNNRKYAKNHEKTILERILEDYGNEGIYLDDWDYYDPEEDCSIIG